VNTNAAFIARGLAEIGINSYFQTTVGDNQSRLKSAVEIAMERSNLLIFSGGLGPTEDDLTKETVAEAFGLALRLDEPSLQYIRDRFAKVGQEMPQINQKQALFPSKSIIIPNPNGTAPGCIIESDKVTAILLPGPPNELIPMFDGFVNKYLCAKSSCVFYSRTVRIFGMGESSVAQALGDIIASQSNPTIAPYAQTGEVKLRTTARCACVKEGELLIAPILHTICERLGEYVYSVDDEELHEVCAKLLKEKKFTLALAESCTGGMLASRLVSIAGSSEWFLEGAVTYSNSAKINRLGVSREALDIYGAVSDEVARAMAKGIRLTSGSDIGLAITGIAGPGGATEGKPVGLVYIAISTSAVEKSLELRLNGNRQRIRELSCLHTLNLLQKQLQNAGKIPEHML